MQLWQLSILKRAAMQRAHPIRNPHAVSQRQRPREGPFCYRTCCAFRPTKSLPPAGNARDPTHNAAEALAVLLEKMNIVRGVMHGCDYSGFETKAAALLVPCANHLLGLTDGKQRFLATMVAVAKAYWLSKSTSSIAHAPMSSTSTMCDRSQLSENSG